MMDNKDMPAMPGPKIIVGTGVDCVGYENRGLSKREYFAIMILQGLAADGYPLNTMTAVEAADKLLKELEK